MEEDHEDTPLKRAKKPHRYKGVSMPLLDDQKDEEMKRRMKRPWSSVQTTPCKTGDTRSTRMWAIMTTCGKSRLAT